MLHTSTIFKQEHNTYRTLLSPLLNTCYLAQNGRA